VGDVAKGYVVFRELGYGVLFFLSAVVGAIITAYIAFFINNIDFPEYAPEGAVKATPIGATLGGVTWLIFRRIMLPRPS
jgi:hypothetical protein